VILLKSFTVLIRVDGDKKIGTGHFSRMISLGKELKKYKHNVIFLTKNRRLLKNIDSTFPIISLSQGTSYEIRKKLQKISADIIILDKLYETNQNLKALQQYKNKLIAIDYKGKNKHLIEKGISILYPKSSLCNVRKSQKFAFTIINDFFIRKKPIKIKKKVYSILILQGGFRHSLSYT